MSVNANALGSHRDKRFLWVFFRPLGIGPNLLFPLRVKLSEGHPPFSHWGVFVTTKTDDFKNFAPRTAQSGDWDTQLGIMWELQPCPDGRYEVPATSVYVSTLCKEWECFTAKSVGTTAFTDEQIRMAGI
jgi:hypothetical protein